MSTNKRRERKSTQITKSTSTPRNRRGSDTRVEAVRSTIDYYEQAMKRPDVRKIMEDLSKL